MSIPRAALPAVSLSLLVLILSACSTPAPSPSAEPTESEAVETEPEETEAQETEPEETEAQETEAAQTEEPDGGETGEFSYDDLLDRIPPSIVENCEPYADNDDLLITAECDMPEGSDADYVEYTLAVDIDEMNALYEGVIDVIGVTETDTGVCPDDLPSEEPYNIDEEEIGRLACALLEDGSGSMVWTDDRLHIIAYATREDGDLAALHEWWTGPDSGPVQ